MGRGPGELTPEDGEVVPLGVEPPPPPSQPRRPMSMHGYAVLGMTLCALGGLLGTLSFFVVGWPGGLARTIKAGIFMSILGFLACGAIAVFAAARDTYPRRGSRPTDE